MRAVEIAGWLRSLGLAQYEATFREHEIDSEVLPELAEADFEKLGIPLGHRKRLLKAIRGLETQAPPSAPPPSPATEPTSDASHLAERRQLTVMFCDLVGSTELAARLDAEDLRDVITRYQACVAETVTRFDGFVAKYMGDGVLAYFGYPHAHEDDAEQAVRAGLALVDAVGGLQASHRLQVRIGIATGLVVVGDLIGAGSAQEQAVVGETPNLAARLQALAEANSIVIADSTRRQVGGRFELTDLGPQILRGFAGPQRAWRVVAENRTLSRFEALRSATTPLIGRAEEIELLMRRWEQAKAGDGRAVLVSAEPGIGKSRLVEAIVERLRPEPHARLRYFGSPHHQESPLHSFIDQLEHAAGFERDDSPQAKRAKLEVLLTSTPLPDEHVELVLELLSLPAGDGGGLADVSPQRKKAKTFEALLGQLARLSAQLPLLMVFEDIHWLDPSSQELLDQVIEQAAEWRALLIATFRPEFQPPWIGHPHVTTLALTRLGRGETALLIRDVAGEDTLPAEILEEIAGRTDGVPLFVEELTKAVIETRRNGEAAALLATAAGPGAAVPATLHASLMARLDHLGSAKEVAQIGAAIGRTFDYDLLAAVSGWKETELQAALRRLVDSGLLFARGVVPQSTYLFKHALVQDAAYGSLLRGRRQQLHAGIVAAFEERSPDIVNAQPALLAQHCAEAGMPEKAADYWLKAGQQAVARSAVLEAAAQLRKGLNVLSSVPDGPRRQQQELDLLVTLRPALVGTKGHAAPELGECLVRARVLAKQINRPEYLLALSRMQFWFHFLRSEHKQAFSLAQQIEKMAEAQNNVVELLLARRAQGHVHCFCGEFVAARSLLAQYQGLSEPTYRFGGPGILGISDDAYATTLAVLALSLAYLGYIDQGRSRLAEALSEARGLRHALTLASVLSSANWFMRLIRSPELHRRAEELLALSTEHGFSMWLALAEGYLGSSSVAMGQAQEGATLLTRGLEAMRAIGTVVFTPTLLIRLAEAHAMLGQTHEGLKFLDESAQLIGRTEERVDEAELHRLRGDLLNAAGNRSEAEWCYRQALTVAERQSAKLYQLRSAFSLARLWRDQGKIADAYDLLAPIYGWFTEGFDASDLVEAKALLSELAERTRSETAGAAALSDSLAKR